MSYSDEDSDRETLSVGLQEGDQRLKQYWAKKARRRSSLFKKFDGDKLALKDNAKIGMLMTKYCEDYIQLMVLFKSLCSVLCECMHLRKASGWGIFSAANTSNINKYCSILLVQRTIKNAATVKPFHMK